MSHRTSYFFLDPSYFLHGRYLHVCIIYMYIWLVHFNKCIIGFNMFQFGQYKDCLKSSLQACHSIFNVKVQNQRSHFIKLKVQTGEIKGYLSTICHRSQLECEYCTKLPMKQSKSFKTSDAICEKIWKINIAVKPKSQEPKEFSNFPQISFPGKTLHGLQ